MHKNIGLLLVLMAIASSVFAQQEDKGTDTFFLAKKSGLLGRLGRSITRNPGPLVPPVKTANQFNKYRGKIIRYIEIVPVGFNQELNDTSDIRNNLAIRIADKFHKNSSGHTIRKNLFFKEGDVLLPLIIADNERFLRDLPYLRDAAIVVYKSIASNDSVDVIVLTRDVFSIGGRFSFNKERMRPIIREENLAGTGSRLEFSGIYDLTRDPRGGFGAEYVHRNIGGSFLDTKIGFKTFQPALVNSRYEENYYYFAMERQLVSRYTQWTGALSFSHHETSDAYPEDSLYTEKSQYDYNNADFWMGYNVGWKRKRGTDSEKRLRHFIATHVFYTDFKTVPLQFKDSFNYNYADLNGLLFSYSLYKQNFYTTKFIYGFGRNEDIPIGLNASLIAGWTNKQGRMRGYYGAELDASFYSKQGFFTSYIVRAGTFRGADKFEDIGVLLSVNHFTRLRRLSKQWYTRSFIAASYAGLYNETLNEPIKLQSDFGLPYFRSDSLNYLEATERSTFKLETVFFNMRKFLGFRFAPFISTDVSILKPVNVSPSRHDAYWALGGGLRTRNENLIFGTIELRCFYFPSVSTTDMAKWKVVLRSNLRYKYNSTLVQKPDIVQLN